MVGGFAHERRNFQALKKHKMRNYFESLARRALTPTGGFLGGFNFSLNPYIGCAFGDNGGCPFCYLRALPIARIRPGTWGSWVVAKSNLLELLARELKSLERAGKLQEATIFMSSATDPYQGMERRTRLTRGALELFAERPPRRVLLQTRSPMVERDLDLLVRLRPRLIASITVETDDERVRRRLTPTSPAIARRLATATAARGWSVRSDCDIADDAEQSRAIGRDCRGRRRPRGGRYIFRWRRLWWPQIARARNRRALSAAGL